METLKINGKAVGCSNYSHKIILSSSKDRTVERPFCSMSNILDTPAVLFASQSRFKAATVDFGTLDYLDTVGNDGEVVLRRRNAFLRSSV